MKKWLYKLFGDEIENHRISDSSETLIKYAEKCGYIINQEPVSIFWVCNSKFGDPVGVIAEVEVI